MNMVTGELILNSDRFVMLDLVNTVIENQISRDYPIVQVVYSSNEYSLENIEAIKSRIKNTRQIEEKRKNLFTITLNVDTDKNNQLFR